MSLLYLVRHCQATGQEPEAPLTETGKRQAIALANRLEEANIQRIIASPFTRAYQSILPLAERLGLTIEIDSRLTERVLSQTPLDNWQEQLAATFVDLDLSFAGGESSRTAMMRGISVVKEATQQAITSVAIVTHGNLMALILKYFDEKIGYAEWQKLQNPDIYCIQLNQQGTHLSRLAESSLANNS
jgi:2,3-bisphosphoglycerate-dependent phosphoglycerate mutase